MINSIFKLIFLGPLWYVLKRRLKNWTPLLIVPYFLYYAIMDALAFEEAMGELFCVMDKNHLRNSLLLTFIVTACINHNPYQVSLFFLLPVYMIVYYFSIDSINREQEIIRNSIMSEEIKLLVPKIPVIT